MEFTSALERWLITIRIYTTSYAFVYGSHLKPFEEKHFCGADNRKDTPICVIDENDIESKKYEKALKSFFGGQNFVEYVYNITPFE